MASKSVANLFATLSLKDRGFNAGMKKSRKASDAFAGKIVGTRKVLDGFSASAGAATGAVAALTFGMLRLHKAAFAVGAQFEKSMLVVKAVTRATANEFLRLEAIARKMGSTTEWTAVQSADALKFLAMAGFGVEKSISALPGVLDLATAGNLDLARSADIASNILTGMQMPVQELSRVNDVLVGTTIRSNTNVELMAESMKYAAPLASALGYSIEEVSAMVGLLGSAGIQGSMAGTQLAYAFQKVHKVFEKLGMDGEGKNLIDALKAAKQAGWGTTEMMDAFGMRGGRASLVLKELIPELEKFTETLRNTKGEAKEVADTMRQSLIVQFNLLKSVTQDAAINIFEHWNDSLVAVVKGLTKFMGLINEAITGGRLVGLLIAATLDEFLIRSKGVFKTAATVFRVVFTNAATRVKGAFGDVLEWIAQKIYGLGSLIEELPWGDGMGLWVKEQASDMYSSVQALSSATGDLLDMDTEMLAINKEITKELEMQGKSVEMQWLKILKLMSGKSIPIPTDLAARLKLAGKDTGQNQPLPINIGKLIDDMKIDPVKSIVKFNEEQAKEFEKTWSGVFDAIKSAGSSLFDDALAGQIKSFGEYFLDVLGNVGSAFTNVMGDMASKKIGGGFMGALGGGFVGGVAGVAAGAVINVFGNSLFGGGKEDSATVAMYKLIDTMNALAKTIDKRISNLLGTETRWDADLESLNEWTEIGAKLAKKEPIKKFGAYGQWFDQIQEELSQGLPWDDVNDRFRELLGDIPQIGSDEHNNIVNDWLEALDDAEAKTAEYSDAIKKNILDTFDLELGPERSEFQNQIIDLKDSWTEFMTAMDKAGIIRSAADNLEIFMGFLGSFEDLYNEPIVALRGTVAGVRTDREREDWGEADWVKEFNRIDTAFDALDQNALSYRDDALAMLTELVDIDQTIANLTGEGNQLYAQENSTLTNMLYSLQGGSLAAVQSMEFFEREWATKMAAAQAGDTGAVSDLNAMLNEFAAFAADTGIDYKDFTAGLISDLSGLQDIYTPIEAVANNTSETNVLLDRIEGNLDTVMDGFNIQVMIDSTEIGNVVAEQVGSNTTLVEAISGVVSGIRDQALLL